MTTPTNHARALHDLLEVVGSSGQTSPQQGWEQALGASYGSVDYARRHAEVVGLYTGTLQQVASLPDKSRERFERYAWPWWMALMAPQHAWSNQVDMSSAVDPGALDQLGSAADVIEARMAGSLAVPTATDLGDLRAVCQEWIEAVLEETDLAEPLRLNLLQDLHHIIWLIEHADLFGVARVTAAGQQIVGNVAAVGPTLPEAKHGVWVERGKKLVKAIVLLGGFAAGVDTGFELTQGATDFIAELTSGSDSAPSAPGPVDGGDDGGAGGT